MAIDFPTGPSVGQQYQFGGTVYTFTAQGVWSPIGAIAGVAPPQGRLTLQSSIPVMITNQVGTGLIYYTPYIGNLVPIFNGAAFVMTAFSELSCASTDTTKNPAAIGVNKLNDWFIWSDSGTVRLGHGPDWTNTTTRSAGTALVRINGILLNNVAITNGPAAQRGTYVGTTYSNSSSLFVWRFPGAGAGGVSATFYVWNAYNRIDTEGMCIETTASWTYSSTTPRAKNSGAENAIFFISGLAEDFARIENHAYCTASSGSASGIAGIGIDSTTVFSGITGQSVSSPGATSTYVGSYTVASLGFSSWYALEAVNIASQVVTFYGGLGGPPARNNNGLRFSFKM